MYFFDLDRGISSTQLNNFRKLTSSSGLTSARVTVCTSAVVGAGLAIATVNCEREYHCPSLVTGPPSGHGTRFRRRTADRPVTHHLSRVRRAATSQQLPRSICLIVYVREYNVNRSSRALDVADRWRRYQAPPPAAPLSITTSGGPQRPQNRPRREQQYRPYK
ncbi:hypothetical protein NP493_877g01025 [Ridgeia piscesae]|uniref:Uncharacterized protein n=1 Tax=Ridgeia piscesae TaxID=27915 RepID=A0AAD9KLH6_RIDPI|nr:hypothetical protein NP493_877g01025 [Ridgeia piscesae]